MPSDPASALPIPDASVTAAMRSRRSVRGFLDRPVARETVEAILALAARAPSGSNMQPWKVVACTGAPKEALTREILAAYRAGAEDHVEDYDYYPEQWREPYLGRRRKLGWDLYGLLGIARGEHARMAQQLGRNFEFFGAPVGLFFTLERDLARGSWIDMGAFLHGVMIAARAYGLDTCPQQAFARFHRIIRRHLDIPASDIVVCGMSLGTADPTEPANRLAAEREPIERFARFRGW